jgi:hypothetical protein
MEYAIKLTQQHLQVISAGLCELPYRVAAPVIDAVNKQIQLSAPPHVDEHHIPPAWPDTSKP